MLVQLRTWRASGCKKGAAVSKDRFWRDLWSKIQTYIVRVNYIILYNYIPYAIGSMYGIYANIYHQYIPVMLAYNIIYLTWILWVYNYI